MPGQVELLQAHTVQFSDLSLNHLISFEFEGLWLSAEKLEISLPRCRPLV